MLLTQEEEEEKWAWVAVEVDDGGQYAFLGVVKMVGVDNVEREEDVDSVGVENWDVVIEVGVDN